MRRTDIVRIGIGWNYSGNPPALPAVLEWFGCRVFVEHIRSKHDLSSFFTHPAVDAQFTIMLTHGWGKTEDEAVLNWPLFDQESGTVSDYHMTPRNMSEIVKTGSGTLISAACRSGKEAFAQGFFQAGFDHYIAPTCSSDNSSALQFLTAFFGYLVYEERDYMPRTVEIAEAVELARQIDQLPDGANCWQYFGKNL